MYEDCQGPFIFSSNTDTIRILDISITKTPSCNKTVVGGTICYTIIIENNNDIDLEEYLFYDILADNLAYIEGSFFVGTEQIEPAIIGNEMSYALNIGANQLVTLSFCVIVIAKASTNSLSFARTKKP